MYELLLVHVLEENIKTNIFFATERRYNTIRCFKEEKLSFCAKIEQIKEFFDFAKIGNKIKKNP